MRTFHLSFKPSNVWYTTKTIAFQLLDTSKITMFNNVYEKHPIRENCSDDAAVAYFQTYVIGFDHIMSIRSENK